MKKVMIMERTSIDRVVERVLDSKVQIAAKIMGEDVHLGVLGARWTWCGLSRVIKAMYGFIFYVNHNEDKAVTCRQCLYRIRLGSPVPLVRNILAREIEKTRKIK